MEVGDGGDVEARAVGGEWVGGVEGLGVGEGGDG